MRSIVFLAALTLAGVASAEGLSDLSWIKGCWRLADQRGEITEVWSAPPIPSLLGYAFTKRDGETVAWESTRIELRDGAFVYLAMPGGHDPVRFPAVSHNDHQIIFENLQHDWPQRIVYERRGAHLVATVSGPGADTEVDDYALIRCTARLRP